MAISEPKDSSGTQALLAALQDAGADVEDALDRFMGDEAMYLKYVGKFPDEQSIHALEKAVEAHDFNAAEKAVHAFKGVVTNLSFTPLADASIDMLEELRDGEIEEALKSYEELQKQYRVFSSIAVRY